VARRPRRRIGTFVVLAVATVAVLGLIAVAIPARFVGEHCFSVRVQPRERSPELVNATADVPSYRRKGASTFLTLPAWYVVYSAEEYAAFVTPQAPSRFPYFGAIWQYWRYYASSCGGTKRIYPFDPRVHVALTLTGLAFTLDNTVKGAYENTVGVVTESIGFYHTEEDVFARKTAGQYAEFVRTAPASFPLARAPRPPALRPPLADRPGLRAVRSRVRAGAVRGCGDSTRPAVHPCSRSERQISEIASFPHAGRPRPAWPARCFLSRAGRRPPPGGTSDPTSETQRRLEKEGTGQWPRCSGRRSVV